MENTCSLVREDDLMDLPPGFRFHPTDEELITHYLFKRVMDPEFSCGVIGEADLNKSEPWDLPWKAKMGEKEWFFFCLRDRKYPTGLRTNRATEAGYWKATGKDKEIYREKSVVGMKKTLVFYKGRAPKGEKSNWVMHEYRLDGIYSVHNLPKEAKNEYVISRVFHKDSSGKKVPISGLVQMEPCGNEIESSGLPPLIDSSPLNGNTKPVTELPPVSCFSTQTDFQQTQGYENHYFNNSQFATLPSVQPSGSFTSAQAAQVSGSLQNPSSISMQQQPFLNALIENQNWSMMQNPKRENEMLSFSQEMSQTTDYNTEISSAMSTLETGSGLYGNQEGPSAIAGTEDLEYIWRY